jgi:hypothetical protein
MFTMGMDADSHRRSLELELQRDPDGRPSLAPSPPACQQIGLTHARCQTLLLLVSEIVTNAVIHSKALPSTPIRFVRQPPPHSRHRPRWRTRFHPEPRGQTATHDGWVCACSINKPAPGE